jgi:hypothetical protein
MRFKKITTVIFFAFLLVQALGQNPNQPKKSSNRISFPYPKFSVSTTYLTFINFGPEKTNTHHYEFHLKYRLTSKDIIGIKVARWKLFAPMGIPMSDPLFLHESEFYPGRLKEIGLGGTYQRFLWKGSFASVEILPLYTTYLNRDNNKAGNGFKLYTTYHFGYHIPLFKNRVLIEPQIQCNYWPVNTNVPQGFKEKDNKWNNYFLFEPNFYIGINL